MWPSDRILMSTDSGRSADGNLECSCSAARRQHDHCDTVCRQAFANSPNKCPFPSTHLRSQSGFQSGSSPKLLMIQTRCSESPENGVHWRRQLASSYAGLETADGQARAVASKRSGNQVSRSADRCILLGWRCTMSASGQRHQHHGGLPVRRETVAAWNDDHRDVQRTRRT